MEIWKKSAFTKAVVIIKVLAIVELSAASLAAQVSECVVAPYQNKSTWYSGFGFIPDLPKLTIKKPDLENALTVTDQTPESDIYLYRHNNNPPKKVRRFSNVTLNLPQITDAQLPPFAIENVNLEKGQKYFVDYQRLPKPWFRIASVKNSVIDDIEIVDFAAKSSASETNLNDYVHLTSPIINVENTKIRSLSVRNFYLAAGDETSIVQYFIGQSSIGKTILTGIINAGFGADLSGTFGLIDGPLAIKNSFNVGVKEPAKLANYFGVSAFGLLVGMIYENGSLNIDANTVMYFDSGAIHNGPKPLEELSKANIVGLTFGPILFNKPALVISLAKDPKQVSYKFKTDSISRKRAVTETSVTDPAVKDAIVENHKKNVVFVTNINFSNDDAVNAAMESSSKFYRITDTQAQEDLVQHWIIPDPENDSMLKTLLNAEACRIAQKYGNLNLKKSFRLNVEYDSSDQPVVLFRTTDELGDKIIIFKKAEDGMPRFLAR